MLDQPRETEMVRALVWRDVHVVTAAGGTVVSAALTAALWGQPAAWLMPVVGMLAVTAAVYDVRTLRIPNRLTLTAGIGQVAIAVPLITSHMLKWSDPVAGAALMSAPLLGSHLLSRSRTPGLGDVKLAAVLGVGVGAVSPTAAYLALVLSLVLGAGFGVVYRSRTGRAGFPLGPAIAASTVIVLVVVGLRELS